MTRHQAEAFIGKSIFVVSVESAVSRVTFDGIRDRHDGRRKHPSFEPTVAGRPIYHGGFETFEEAYAYAIEIAEDALSSAEEWVAKALKAKQDAQDKLSRVRRSRFQLVVSPTSEEDLIRVP